MNNLTTIAAPSRPESKAPPSDACTCPDAQKLRRLRDGLERNAMATVRIIDQVLAELDRHPCQINQRDDKAA